MDSPNQSDDIDVVANDLDELTTTVDELKENPPQGVKSETVAALDDALEKAKEAADDLEEERR
ncbi:MAG TPA: hypothetical protein VGJ29_13185 [Vicinamibacterales bacterium]|jgi:hypothetical protein